MLGLIGIIVVLCWICNDFGTEAGAIAILVVLAGLFVLGCIVSHEDTKAWANWRRYWAEGGPERNRRR